MESIREPYKARISSDTRWRKIAWSIDTQPESDTSLLIKIGQKYDCFISGPVFDSYAKASADLWNVGHRIITVRIKYECAEQDEFFAKNCITREMILLCEREGISLE